jgi:hypothetical protein
VNATVFLQTPQQHDYTNPAVELNHKRLAKWLKQLPLLNLVASVRELLGALEPANMQRMPAKTRIRLLERYRETVVNIFPSAEDEVLRRLPLTSAQRGQVKEDMIRLCSTLAAGYKILVKEGLDEQVDPRRQPIMLLATYRAVETSSMTLLHAYRTYQPAPPFTYLDLHQLYRYAEQWGIADSAVAFDRKMVDADGIGASYKRIMLLAVLDPLHLAAGTAVPLFELLGRHAGKCSMEPAGDGAGDPCAFLVDLDGDSPPLPSAKAATGYPVEQPRILHVRPAIDRARQRLSELCAQADWARIHGEEVRLLGLLVPELEKDRLRQTPRKAVNRETLVAVGLEAIHYYLSRGPGHLAELLKGAESGIQVDDLDSEREARYTLDPWMIVNHSVNGFMLTSRRNVQRDVRVGDALGVIVPRNAQQPPQLTAACVRWMRNTTDRRVEIGVEVIPGNMTPVTCVPGDELDFKYGELAGLLVSGVPGQNLPATLITPKTIYSPDRPLSIQTATESLQVRAAELIMDTAAFDRFTFETLER